MQQTHLEQITDWPKPGRYILAVSGGVDSMCMLDMFASAAKTRSYDLVVAHVNHGLRPDSTEDQQLVQRASEQDGLPFETTDLHLKQPSEEAAREGRYHFLMHIMDKYKAAAIVTAHTRDDQLETVVFAGLRTGGGRGLIGMASQPPVLRPLLAVTKAKILDYATHHRIVWREDSSNADPKYARNALRHQFLPFAEAEQPGFGEFILKMSEELTSGQGQLEAGVTAWLLDNSRVIRGTVTIDRRALRRLELPTVLSVLSHTAHKYFPSVELTGERLYEAARYAKVALDGTVDMVGGLVLAVQRTSITLAIAPTGRKR